jgi:tetratricopeptide (TPR) repeat protein
LVKWWIGAMGAAAMLFLPAQVAAQEATADIALPALERQVQLLDVTGTPEDQEAAKRELGEAYNTVGLDHWRSARYDSAVIRFDQASAVWAELGDRAWLARVYNNLGATHYQWGHYEPALDAFLRSLALRRQLGDPRGLALVLTNIGRTYLDWQQFGRARPALDEAIEYAALAEEPFVLGYTLHNLGVLHFTMGSNDAARETFRRSLDAYVGDDPHSGPTSAFSGWALNILYLGLLHVREGDYDGGIALLQEALEEAVDKDQPQWEARALVHLGHAHLAEGDLAAAIMTLERGMDAARVTGQRTLVVDALKDLAAAHEARGEHQHALARLRAHNVLRDSIFNQGAVQRLAAMEARAEADRQLWENARLQEAQRAREGVIARQRIVGALGGALLLVTLILVAALARFNQTIRSRGRELALTNTTLDETNRELRAALSEVRTLEGLIPICMHCKKVRDDEGFWEAVESYISSRSDARFSHGICAECGPMHYGEDWLQPYGEPAHGDPGPDTDV